MPTSKPTPDSSQNNNTPQNSPQGIRDANGRLINNNPQAPKRGKMREVLRQEAFNFKTRIKQSILEDVKANLNTAGVDAEVYARIIAKTEKALGVKDTSGVEPITKEEIFTIYLVNHKNIVPFHILEAARKEAELYFIHIGIPAKVVIYKDSPQNLINLISKHHAVYVIGTPEQGTLQFLDTYCNIKAKGELEYAFKNDYNTKTEGTLEKSSLNHKSRNYGDFGNVSAFNYKVIKQQSQSFGKWCRLEMLLTYTILHALGHNSGFSEEGNNDDHMNLGKGIMMTGKNLFDLRNTLGKDDLKVENLIWADASFDGYNQGILENNRYWASFVIKNIVFKYNFKKGI